MLNADMIYEAADYLRLSKEDGDFSLSNDKLESDSISSQRAIIERFVAQNPNIKLVAEFCDDGYTGTNFDRPDFQRMMEAVKAGKINCVIVKDLSRFGRDYIDAGKYIEKIFPQLGVRFIAVNDNYDSLNHSTGDSLVLPVKNFLNDSYSRDISIKVRSSFESRRQDGEFIANYTAYGYLRDPENKNKLVIDEVAGEYVREIFQWKIEGMSPVTIAEKLNGRGVLPPSEYKRSIGIKYKTAFQTSSRRKWSPFFFNDTATTEIYTGVLIQGRRTTPNYKVKKVIIKDKSEWSRIENAHEAIIPAREFQLVQRLMQEDGRRAPGSDTVYPLSGRVFCGTCGALAKRKSVSYNGKKYAYYACPTRVYEHEWRSGDAPAATARVYEHEWRPGDAPAATSGLYEHECQTAAEEKSCGVSEQIQDVWYSGTGICDHMCGMSVQQLVEYIVGCAFDSINSVYQYMHGTI